MLGTEIERVGLDALRGTDPAAAVTVAEEHPERRAVQLPPGLREEAVAAAVQGADHRTEQRRTGQVTERGVLVELEGQVALQLVQALGVVRLGEAGRSVPGGHERLMSSFRMGSSRSSSNPSERSRSGSTADGRTVATHRVSG